MRTWSLRFLRQFLDLALSALRVLAAAASVAFKSQAALHLENLALRHQLGVLRRSVKRPRLSSADRLLWAWLCEVWSDWRSALVIVKPETLIAWHRKGFRLFWTWKGFRCEVLGGGDSGQYKLLKRESGLGKESEQLADEVSLADRISFGQPVWSKNSICLNPMMDAG